MPAGYLRTAIGWLPLAVILAAACGLLASQAWQFMATRPVHLAAAVAAKPATVGMAKETAFDPAISEAIVPLQPAPVDRLKIASQSWRRGGLGSKALVTMTLRNDNSYAVKNIDVSCAFRRPDGTYLTSRSRVITEAINMKSRKTFARLHVGFVNVNAAKAKCSLVAASHV
jgi:type IV pilus biogenesis protein CpaD/CtpE